MIEVSGLTKKYGEKTAVNDLSFRRATGDRDRVPRPQRGR